MKNRDMKGVCRTPKPKGAREVKPGPGARSLERLMGTRASRPGPKAQHPAGPHTDGRFSISG